MIRSGPRCRMPMMSRSVCIFCQQSAKLSAEHLWPAWMTKIFVDQGSQIYNVMQRGPQAEFTRRWTSRSINLTAKLVCEKCNNRWMSDLENSVKLVIDGMVRDITPKSLLPRDLASVATFTFKNAVVADHMRTMRKPFFSPSLRRRFAISLEMPGAIQMWLSAFSGVYRHSGIFRGYYYQHRSRPTDAFNFYVFTFVAGRFAVQMVAKKWIKKRSSWVPLPTFTQNSSWDSFSIPFWRTGADFLWPPGQHLSYQIIESFSDRWSRLIRR